MHGTNATSTLSSNEAGICHCGAHAELDHAGSCEACVEAADAGDRAVHLERHALTLVPAVEHDATALFEDESIDWRYCTTNAAFSHRDACEYLLHIPEHNSDLQQRLAELTAYGCTDALLELHRAAHQANATWLLLYA